MSSQPIHRGSVKDIFENEENNDQLIFRFSDRYSVFDWGEMPDQISKKGESLAYLGILFFEFLADPANWKSWKSHSLTLSTQEEELLDKLKKSGVGHHFIRSLENDSRSFIVKKIHISKPPFQDGCYDYSAYQNQLEDTLIPLEVVFRFGLPEGSSLLNRLDNEDYRRILGLNHRPEVGEKFNRPLIEFSTKLESTDRYISYSDAQKMAGLSDMEFARLFGLCTLLSLRLKDLFNQMNIELWDGKFEFAFSKIISSLQGRDIILIDSIGPDELRLVSKGAKLSKEFLRSAYRGTSWLKSVNVAKSMAKERGTKDWKNIVIEELHEAPKPLDERYSKAASLLYPGLTNEIAKSLGGNPPFQECGGLDEFHSYLANSGVLR
ncbi:MAG: phosphoribosylaminoimidazole succinocarboxamide synthase [Halobacteriovoraceae bacterium]|nr:phosphoribosylaminoimidazole succinocarboxamide synthase [Halobacteriovoraceae bacterium]|tara:strand:- start:10717 stop:11853 length:1137 start_codon:yes stop_codon:yes gene_type:complete